MKKKKEAKPNFVPALPTSDVDTSGGVLAKAPFKLIQVVEYANLSCMFDGFSKVLGRYGIKFEQLSVGVAVLFINTNRDYIKLVVGNGTPAPVIAAYRFPKGIRLPSEATKEVVRSFLKRGEVQMDDRLRLAIGDTLKNGKRERVVS